MTLDLLSLDLHRHAQSYITVLGFGCRCLLYVEWTPELKLARLQFLFIQWV